MDDIAGRILLDRGRERARRRARRPATTRPRRSPGAPGMPVTLAVVPIETLDADPARRPARVPVR